MGRLSIYRHPLDRDTIEWTSLGKFGKGPIRTIVVSQLSDGHLMKIIEFIERNNSNRQSDIKTFLEDEVIYRVTNNIHVDEYYGENDPIEGKDLYDGHNLLEAMRII